MQHIEEGTIHGWLDGALSPEETAQVEAHVAGCQQCASAVAEARGFIAGSSRILTALDNAPRGVIPAAAPRKRVDPLVLRVAATVLVVAIGTLVVVRNYGSNEHPGSVPADRVTMSQQKTSATVRVPAVTAPTPATSVAGTAEAAPGGASRIALSRKAMAPSSRADIGARENKALAGGMSVRAGNNSAASDYVGIAAPSAPTLAQSRVAGDVAMDAASGAEPLRVVATPRRNGAKVTLYEVARGNTVTLTESMPIYLDPAVVTGATASPMARQATGKSAAAPSKARADAPITIAAPDSQRALSAPMALAAAPPHQTGAANAVHTITWTDSATGSTLTLTGRMPEARLQEIRVRIERERAATKKNP